MEDRSVIHPHVSVIIPAYYDNARLQLCLEALSRQTYPGPIQIVVVDNAADFTLADFAAKWSQVEFAHEAAPGSYAARNKGLSLAKGDILAFTDSDCRPHEGWIENAVAFLMADPSIGMIGGRVNIVVDHNGPPSVAELFETVFAFPQDNYIRQGHFAATANMITRREVISQVGPFNAALRSGGDADFGNRAFAAGVRQAYVGSAQVDHPARDSAEELFRKVRRTVGGQRDRKPGWADCVKATVACLPPSRRRALAIIRHKEPRIAWSDKVRLLWLAALLQWAGGFERLRLQLTRAASARA